jgi:hypothetical protein
MRCSECGSRGNRDELADCRGCGALSCPDCRHGHACDGDDQAHVAELEEGGCEDCGELLIGSYCPACQTAEAIAYAAGRGDFLHGHRAVRYGQGTALRAAWLAGFEDAGSAYRAARVGVKTPSVDTNTRRFIERTSGKLADELGRGDVVDVTLAAALVRRRAANDDNEGSPAPAALVA